MTILSRIIPILIACVLYPSGALSGDLSQGRLVRPDDAALRQSLATAHFARGEPIEVLAITPLGENATAQDHFNSGTALLMTGRYVLASEAFHRAILSSPDGSDLHQKATLQFLRMSPYNPGLTLPWAGKDQIRAPDPELALALSGYLADRGDRQGALTMLEKTNFRDGNNKVVSGILSASHLAAGNNWDASSKLIGKVKNVGIPALTDLLYLTRGYHFLQGGQPDRAKNSFSNIPVSSPYAPEALLGKAWSHIRTRDLQSASIILEELIDRHRYSKAAGDGAMDLAIVYRDLGLYDRAGTILDQHLDRLQEVRNWLLEMRDSDLRSGSDIITVLESALDGSRPNPDVIQRTPAFARQWVIDTGADPIVIQTTALLKGIDLAKERTTGLNKRLNRDVSLVRKEINWINNDISKARATMARLEEIRNRLNTIKEDMRNTLQLLSLRNFASKKALLLINRTGELKLRLSLLENSVGKAEGFTSLVEKLSESVTVTEEESQMNRIRKQAYEGLISSRSTLRRYKNSLSALEGQLWLEVKGGAIDLEKKTSLRVTSGRTRAGQASADTAKTVRMLDNRLKALENLEKLLVAGTTNLDTAFPGKLYDLRARIETRRSSRLLLLADKKAREIRDAEALILYTSADIETSRMQNIVQSLQEAVE